METEFPDDGNDNNFSYQELDTVQAALKDLDDLGLSEAQVVSGVGRIVAAEGFVEGSPGYIEAERRVRSHYANLKRS